MTDFFFHILYLNSYIFLEALIGKGLYLPSSVATVLLVTAEVPMAGARCTGVCALPGDPPDSGAEIY